ncbi:unnamed protein product [Allacma fusca]|uniref:Protein kinase domain-containing protein n=1 Tax=Allacma fusca TaxID=39272 RepID=A0A8J2JJZ9_9HEXA|nr:unnamed protein product [Allacma fusca]
MASKNLSVIKTLKLDWVKSELNINITTDPIINSTDWNESGVNVIVATNSSPNPIISYCTSETDSLSVLQECNFTRISNSTFDFGKIDQNVIQMESKSGPQFVFLKCEALYPIRWMAPKPLGSIQYLATNETKRFHHDPLSKPIFNIYSQEFRGNYTIPVTKSDHSGKQLKELDDKCAECICRASSRCKIFPCNSDKVCGYISPAYRGDTQDQEFSSCMRQEVCARGTENKIILTECLVKNKLTFTRLRNQPGDYDPRIGLKVDELPDPNFKYEFNIPWDLEYTGSLILKPLKQASRISANLYFDKITDLIYCEITTPGTYPQPNLLVGRCASFAECQLKFDHLWPAIPGVGFNKLLHQVEEFAPSDKKFRKSFGSTTYSQGLDNTRHLLSNNFPSESIIKMSSTHEQPLKEGMKYSFDCTISTFVLLPNIEFTLGFENGNVQLVTVISQTDWAQSESNIKVASDLLNWYIKIGGVIAGVIIVNIAVLIVFVARRKVAVVDKTIPPEEVDKFILGIAVTNSDQGERMAAEYMAFKPELIVSSQELFKDNKFFGAVIDELPKGKCEAVIEFSPLGNLQNYLRKHSNQNTVESSKVNRLLSEEMELQDTLQLPVLLHFCKQIASGMRFLAEKNVIHGDLATRNVLVFHSQVVKITDFGLSKKLYADPNFKMDSKVPLPWAWMALESLCFFEYSTQSDVWSFGVTMWEIFSMGRTPFYGIRPNDYTNQLQAGLRLPKPTLASEDIYNFILTCWENNPHDRPEFSKCEAFISSVELGPQE